MTCSNVYKTVKKILGTLPYGACLRNNQPNFLCTRKTFSATLKIGNNRIPSFVASEQSVSL